MRAVLSVADLDYTDYNDAPPWHVMVVVYTMKDITPPDIAQMLNRSEEAVRKVLEHPPIREKIGYLKNLGRTGVVAATSLMTEMRLDGLLIIQQRLKESMKLAEFRKNAIDQAIESGDRKAYLAACKLPKGISDKDLAAFQKAIFDYHPDREFSKTPRLEGPDDAEKVGGKVLKELKARAASHGHKPISYKPATIDVEVVDQSENPPENPPTPLPIDTNN